MVADLLARLVKLELTTRQRVTTRQLRQCTKAVMVLFALNAHLELSAGHQANQRVCLAQLELTVFLIPKCLTHVQNG